MASEHRNIRPILITAKGYKALIWLHGPWYTCKDCDVDVAGIIIEDSPE